MSIDKKIYQLSFPWDGVLPTEVVVALRDVDIVGVGSFRQSQIRRLLATKQVYLLTHATQVPSEVHAIYQAEMFRTMSWFRPLKVMEGAPLDLKLEFVEVFNRIFPLTRQNLGIVVDRLRDEYLLNMAWSSWLLQDHWRLFVGFLRQKFPGRPDIIEVAHWEWVRSWIEFQSFESEKGEPGILSLNPSLQLVVLSSEQALLKKEKGLYAFVFQEENGLIEEKTLDIVEALFLDLLQEDLKYSREQLLAQAALRLTGEGTPSAPELKTKLIGLIAADIIRVS